MKPESRLLAASARSEAIDWAAKSAAGKNMLPKGRSGTLRGFQVATIGVEIGTDGTSTRDVRTSSSS